MPVNRQSFTFLAGLLLCAMAVLSAFGLWFAKTSYRDLKLDRLASCPETYGSLSSDSHSAFYAFLGDSRAWELALWLEGNRHSVLNLAVPGETSFETLCKSKAKINLDTTDKTLIISLGINDLVTASMLDEANRQRIQAKAVENIVALSSDMSEKFAKVVVLSVVPPIDPDLIRSLIWGRGISDEVQRLNLALERNLPGNILLLDTKDIFYNPLEQAWRSDLARDALHWNEQAFVQLHEKIESLVKN